MDNPALFELKDTTGNPAPLGLAAFGMTTVLLNLHNAGFYEFSAMILAMGMFYGGTAQVIAGIMEWKKNNTFGTTAFISYGFFWLSLVALKVMPKLGWSENTSKTGMIWFLLAWGVFTLLLFFGTLKLSRALQIVFLSLTVLFFLLVLGDATDSPGITQFAGVEGILCGLSAVYTGIGQVINELYGKIVFPLGLIKK